MVFARLLWSMLDRKPLEEEEELLDRRDDDGLRNADGLRSVEVASEAHLEMLRELITEVARRDGEERLVAHLAQTGLISDPDVTSVFSGYGQGVPPATYHGLLRSLRLFGCVLINSAAVPITGERLAAAWITFSCSDGRMERLQQIVRDFDEVRILKIAPRIHFLAVKAVAQLAELQLALDIVALAWRRETASKAAQTKAE